MILQKCDDNSINKKYNYVDTDIEVVTCLTDNGWLLHVRYHYLQFKFFFICYNQPSS
jgi:hypothetical protein